MYLKFYEYHLILNAECTAFYWLDTLGMSFLIGTAK